VYKRQKKVHAVFVSRGASLKRLYNKGFENSQPGPSNLFNMITKRLTMKGLIVSDWLAHQGQFEQEVGRYFRDGKLKNKETVVVGIDQAVSAFIGLFEGKNVGKMVVKLD
jgi:NADPH-dependent curcumin reductase CurA